MDIVSEKLEAVIKKLDSGALRQFTRKDGRPVAPVTEESGD